MALKLTDLQRRALADIMVGGLLRRHAFWQHRTSGQRHMKSVVEALRSRGLLVDETQRLDVLSDEVLSLYGRREARDACVRFGIEIPEGVE